MVYLLKVQESVTFVQDMNCIIIVISNFPTKYSIVLNHVVTSTVSSESYYNLSLFGICLFRISSAVYGPTGTKLGRNIGDIIVRWHVKGSVQVRVRWEPHWQWASYYNTDFFFKKIVDLIAKSWPLFFWKLQFYMEVSLLLMLLHIDCSISLMSVQNKVLDPFLELNNPWSFTPNQWPHMTSGRSQHYTLVSMMTHT